MQFQSSLVCFFDRELQRVIKRLRRFAHRAREIFRPRFDWRSVQCIASRANLEDNRVEPQLRRTVENRQQLCSLFRDREVAS